MVRLQRGVALAADGLAAHAVVTTMLGAAAGVVSWIAIELAVSGRPTATGSSIAAVVGLVAITPGAGFVTPTAAMVIGGLSAAASLAALRLLDRTRLDDTLDVFACHGVGMLGSLLTGVFATTAVNAGGADGLLAGNPGLLGAQAVGVVAAAAWAAAGTAVILATLRATLGVRASHMADTWGIDLVEHAERAYVRDRTPLGGIIPAVRPGGAR